MSINFKHNRSAQHKKSRICCGGFLVLEQVVAIAVGALVSIMIITTSLAAVRHIRHTAHLNQLHSAMLFVSDTFSYQIRQSKLVSPQGDTSFLLTDPSGTTREVRWQDETLFFDDFSLHGDRIRVSGFWYRIYPRSVQYGVTLAAASSTEHYSATTTVALRR